MNAAAAHMNKQQRDPNVSSESPYMSSLPSPYYGVTENQSVPSWPTPQTSRETSPISMAVSGPATPAFTAEEGVASEASGLPTSGNASHFNLLSEGGDLSKQDVPIRLEGATDSGNSGYPKFEEVPLEQAQEVPQRYIVRPFSYSPTVASRPSFHGGPFQPRSFVPSTQRVHAVPETGDMPRGYEAPWVPTGDAAQRANGKAFESVHVSGRQSDRLVQMERNFRMSRTSQTFAVSCG